MGAGSHRICLVGIINVSILPTYVIVTTENFVEEVRPHTCICYKKSRKLFRLGSG